MVMAVHLVFRSEVVLYFVSFVGCQEDVGIDVSDQDWFTNSNDLAFHFEPADWVAVVNHPQTIG
jgi:hypothetical protein